ncbi:MAG: serine hydrolase [Actinomycetales bacterium]|nr:serine hydrolase [Candidatus Phosphoribacter baldrii]
MVALSDNDATNALIGIVGVGEVSRLLGRAGTRHTVLRRRMMDPAAAARVGERDVRRGLSRVAGRAPSRRAAAPRSQPWRWRSCASNSSMRPSGLPAGTSGARQDGEPAGRAARHRRSRRGDAWVSVAALATDLMDGPIDRGTSVFPTWAAIGQAVAGLLPS